MLLVHVTHPSPSSLAAVISDGSVLAEAPAPRMRDLYSRLLALPVLVESFLDITVIIGRTCSSFKCSFIFLLLGMFLLLLHRHRRPIGTHNIFILSECIGRCLIVLVSGSSIDHGLQCLLLSFLLFLLKSQLGSFVILCQFFSLVIRSFLRNSNSSCQ